MLISLDDYWMGRNSRYRSEWTQDVRDNANTLLERVNRLMPFMRGVDFEPDPQGFGIVASGWRPPSYNATVPGAAIRSLHMTGQAIDLFDPDGDIDAWCWAHQDVLGRPDIDLYMEHPSATKGWCHLQCLPPKSQRHLPLMARRIWFYP